MRKTRLRMFCTALAVLILFAQLFIMPLTVFADDPTEPPAQKPDNIIRDLAGNLDYTGDISGGRCLATKKTFPTFNLKKYDFIEFDIYLDCDGDRGMIRFYFLDNTYKDQNAGRGFYDFWTPKGEWTHIKVASSGFECGYDMNGKVERMSGVLFERLENAKKTDRIIVANMCLTANHVVSPDTMPERLLVTIGKDLDFAAKEDSTAVSGITAISKTDFTYGDFVELDYYVEAADKTDKTALSVYDANGKKSVYSFDASCNGWNHLKIPYREFVGEADLTKIVKYGCDKFAAGNYYHFANMCLTGIAIPGTYPQNTSVKLPAVIDYTGTKSADTVTPFGITVDMTAHDYVEFDLYIEAEDSFDQPYFFAYDSGYSGSGGPLSNNRRQVYLTGIENGKWNHVRLTVYSLMNGKGKGDLSKAAGIYISNLTKNTRYYLADLCLTDAVAPQKKNIFTEVKATAGNISYRGTDYSLSKLSFNDDGSALDVSGNGYIEFDFYAVSENSRETVKFGLADGTYNGTAGVKTSAKSVNANEWSHIALPVSSFAGSGDLTKAVALAVVSPSVDIKYYVSNVSVTDVVAPDMNNDFELKKDLKIGWDYSGNNSNATVKRFDILNLNDYGYLEFDICIVSDKPTQSTRLMFIDTSSGMGFTDFSVETCGWRHMVIPVSAFDTGYGLNGNRTCVNGFMLDLMTNGERKIIKNVCLTSLSKPELNTKYKAMKKTGAEINYFYKDGSSAYNTQLKTEKTDMMQYDYTEFDVFIYGNDSSVRLFFLDSTFSGKGTGCGFYDFSVTPKQWNHIIISNEAFDTGYDMGGNKNDVCGYMLDGMEKGNQYILTNMYYTSVDVPPLNTKYELKKQLNGVKWCFSGMSDPYATLMPIEKTDATQYQYLEFDAFVESASQTESFRMFFFDDTYKRQNAGRGFTDIKIPANQWNHMVIELKNFNTGYEMNGKLSTLSGFNLDLFSKSNSYFIFNVCFTNRKQSVPYDEGDRPVQPDKGARYISVCDTPIDTVGAWNSDAAYFTSNYKTEGKKSLALKVDNQPENVNNFKFGLESPADFSKTGTIRFDLMIDDIKLAQKTTASVVLSSNRRGTSKNHTYDFDFSGMKEGWNSVEVPISAFKGDANLSSISCFMITIHSQLAPDDFYVLCLDNIRAVKTFTLASENGSATSGETIGIDMDGADIDFDFDFDFDDTDDFDIEDEGIIDAGGETTKKIIRRFKRNGNGGISTDKIVLFSVSGGCLLLILAALLLLLITKRRLDKLTKREM